MHAYVIARGHPDFINRWENDCLAHYIPFKYDQYLPVGELQFTMRPIRLYEAVFPEIEYNRAMNMIWPNLETPGMRIPLFAFRKMLGADKPQPWTKNPKLMIKRQNVTVELIGTRKDMYANGVEQI